MDTDLDQAGYLMDDEESVDSDDELDFDMMSDDAGFDDADLYDGEETL